MKSKTAISALVAMSLTTGGFAVAQGYGNRNDGGRNDSSQRGGQQDSRDNDRRDNDRNDRGRNNQSQHGDQHDSRDFGRAHNEDRRDERGAGPNHAFHRGERLPMEYRHHQYVVDDWRGHQLSAPPRGSYWVQTGADYVLVAIATGIILQLFLGR